VLLWDPPPCNHDVDVDFDDTTGCKNYTSSYFHLKKCSNALPAQKLLHFSPELNFFGFCQKGRVSLGEKRKPRAGREGKGREAEKAPETNKQEEE